MISYKYNISLSRLEIMVHAIVVIKVFFKYLVDFGSLCNNSGERKYINISSFPDVFISDKFLLKIYSHVA